MPSSRRGARLAVAAATLAFVVAGAAIAAPSSDVPIFRTDRVMDCVPAHCGSHYTVSATAATDDGWFLGYNVVLASGTGPEEAADIASTLANGFGGRLLVRFFAESAGAEQFIFGPIPAGAAPVEPPETASYLGSIDVLPGWPASETWVQ
jgi:hypothetical protein